MPRRPRTALEPGYFHVINRSVRKAPLFQRARDYRAFFLVLEEGFAKHPVRLLAYCVLANHWHLVVGPTSPATLSKLMHWVTVTHAVRWRLHRKTVGEGPVYQGRFKSEAVVTTEQLVRVCRYVERNALRAGLVPRSQDWPWCSLSERLRPQFTLPLVTTQFLSSPAWIEHVNAPFTLQERLGRPGTMEDVSVENRPVPLRDVAEAPGGFAGGAEGVEQGGRVGGRADENQADAHVERTEHLGVGQRAGALQPLKERRNHPTLPVDLEAPARRQHARQVLDNPAPRNVRHSLDPAARKQRLDDIQI